MRYRVFTDGACDHITCTASAGYIIITEDTFIGMGGHKFKNDNIALTETTAIALACDFIKQKVGLQEGDVIEVFSDSKAAISFIKELLGQDVDMAHTNELISAIHKDLWALNKDYTLHIQKVRAHKVNANPNKVADRIAKFLLRGDVDCLQS